MEKFSDVEEMEMLTNFRTCFTTFSTSKVGKSHYKDILEMTLRNESWRFIFFNDKDVCTWMKKYAEKEILDIFLRTKYKASQMDIFRLCLVREYGGVFLSLNRVIEKPFDELILDQTKAVISFEQNNFERVSPSNLIPSQFKGKQVVQWAIIGPKNHHFFSIALAEIASYAPSLEGRKVASAKEAIWDFSAPRSLTRALDRYLNPSNYIDVTFQGIDYEYSGREAHGAYVRYISNPSYLGDRNVIVLS